MQQMHHEYVFFNAVRGRRRRIKRTGRGSQLGTFPPIQSGVAVAGSIAAPTVQVSCTAAQSISSLAGKFPCPTRALIILLLQRIRTQRPLSDRVSANARGEQRVRGHAVFHPPDQRVKGGVRVGAGASVAVMQTGSKEQAVEVVYIGVERRDALVVLLAPAGRDEWVGLVHS
jgi:hypothetical protein